MKIRRCERDPDSYSHTPDDCHLRPAIRGREDRLEKDPDLRVQERVLLVFSKFVELGSARQTLLWFLEHGLQVPVSAPRDQVVWRRPPVHHDLQDVDQSGVRGRVCVRQNRAFRAV